MTIDTPTSSAPGFIRRSLHTHMRNPTTYVITGLSALVIVLLLVVAFRGGSVATKAEAALPAEAVALVASLEQDITEYAEGDKMIQAGTKIRDRAAAAAKGKDLTLCAEYELRYDRATKKLVSDAECPLF